jgi:hypothetical protein
MVLSVIPANPGSGPGQAPESSPAVGGIDAGLRQGDDFFDF